MSGSIIHINGRPSELPISGKLSDVLRREGIDPDQSRGVAVAINEHIVRKSEWPERNLESGDAVEIVTARQGG